MKELKLGNKKIVTLIDDEDFELISQHKWHFHSGYVIRKSNGKIFWLHREILRTPQNMFVDHINGDKLDNRKNNLRLATAQQNQMNKPKQNNNTSGFKGVYFYKNGQGYESAIRFNKKKIHLGFFDNPIEAAKKYDTAATKYFREFANLNFKAGGVFL